MPKWLYELPRFLCPLLYHIDCTVCLNFCAHCTDCTYCTELYGLYIILCLYIFFVKNRPKKFASGNVLYKNVIYAAVWYWEMCPLLFSLILQFFLLLCSPTLMKNRMRNKCLPLPFWCLNEEAEWTSIPRAQNELDGWMRLNALLILSKINFTHLT